MRFPKLLLTLAVALLALVPLAGTAQAAEPGVNVASLSHDSIAEGLATGAKTIRLFASWQEMEPRSAADYPNGGNAADYDAAIRQINAAGAQPLFVVLNTPQWESGSGDPLVPPANPQDYADFIGKFAAHNKALGFRIAGYEVWNEPDAETFWHAPIDPARYTALLKASFASIKAADPSATVVTGPTTGNNYTWIQQLYNNGAGGNFDVVSVHTDTACLDRGPDAFYRDPNGALAQFTFLGYRSVHDVMTANGDGAKPIWMSELGWSSTGGGPTSCTRGQWAGQKPSGVTEAAQAQYLTQAYACMANDPYVQRADWFTFRDTSGNGVDELNHYGLVRTDGAPKPVLSAFKAVAAANGGGAAECGDFGAPSIRIIKPTPGQQFVDKLDLSAAATDTGVGLARITFSYDNQPAEIRNFTANLLNNTPVGLAPWQGSGTLPLGPHTITVTALDKNGNTATASVQVTKVALTALRSTLTPTVKFKSKKVKCTKKRVCSISGSMSRAAAAKKGAVPSLGGKVAVEWQFRNKKGKWRKLVGGLKPANKAFTFKAKLKYKGKWRVRVVYQGQAPWKKVTSKWITFTVKK
jgi:Glycosyl hydrolase catalytic core/Bacterial Ig domain